MQSLTEKGDFVVPSHMLLIMQIHQLQAVWSIIGCWTECQAKKKMIDKVSTEQNGEWAKY